MKKIAIFLISAILSMACVNTYAQTETNTTDGCSFRFVLSDPMGIGWHPERGIAVIVNGVDYGFVNLPWGTPSTEETLLLPSGEILFSWIGGAFHYLSNYFEIYNSLDELVYTSPDDHILPEGLFFTYQTECNIGINNYSSALHLYPNPASHVVNISGKNIAAIKIFNNIGQLINTYHNVNTINVSPYKAGIYIFNITTLEGNIKAFKVVITK